MVETPYAEGQGDNGTLTLTTGNAHGGNASALQIDSAAQSSGENVVGILISGRPLVLGEHLESFDSFIAAWLPGLLILLKRGIHLTKKTTMNL